MMKTRDVRLLAAIDAMGERAGASEHENYRRERERNRLIGKARKRKLVARPSVVVGKAA